VSVTYNGVRLGKGQKRGTKKSCTVSVTYSFNPNVRTAEDVVASLFKETTNTEVNHQGHTQKTNISGHFYRTSKKLWSMV